MGGVAVQTPPSLSTDLGDDNTGGGRMAASPTISRSDASGCQPARSGRSVDSHSLQWRQAAIGAALHRIGSEQQSPMVSGGDAGSGGLAAPRHRAKRPRSNVALEKVWGWLEGGTLEQSTPAAASNAAVVPSMPLPLLDQPPTEMCSRQGSLHEPLPPSAAADAPAAPAASLPRGALAEAFQHDAQPSRPLKRKSLGPAPPASPTLPPPPNPGAPEVDLECMLAHSNLERSRVARLDDAALAQHDAALLAGLADAHHSPPAAAASEQNPPSVSQWAPPSAAVAIPSAAPAQPFGSMPAAAAVSPDGTACSFSIGAASAEAPPRFQSGSGLATDVAAAAVGGIASSAPPEPSPAAAATGGQRRRCSMQQ